MDNLNYVFFEEFKRLDKLCRELYNAEGGITNYINDMKAVSWNDYRYIPNWKADLEQLIQLRHNRNLLAHTEGAFDEVICTQNDIDWIKDFHKRILNQIDPIAVLYQKSKAQNQELGEPHINRSESDQTSRNGMPLSKKIIFAVAVVLVLVIVYITIRYGFIHLHLR